MTWGLITLNNTKIKIDWLDGQESKFDNVERYEIDYENKFARIVYKDNNQTHKLIVNLLSVSCILSTEIEINEKI